MIIFISTLSKPSLPFSILVIYYFATKNVAVTYNAIAIIKTYQMTMTPTIHIINEIGTPREIPIAMSAETIMQSWGFTV